MKLIFWGVEISVTEEQATQLLARYHGAQKISAVTALQQLKAGERVGIAGYTYYPDGPWLVGWPKEKVEAERLWQALFKQDYPQESKL